MIISRTPFRVSFFGGGTDYPDWYLEHGGQVLSTTIDKYCYIACRPLPPFFDYRYRVVYSRIETVKTIDQIRHPAVKAVLRHLNCRRGLSINYDGDLPARSGLGTSSSFTVGLLNALYALRGQYSDADRLAREALHVEQVLIGEPVGSQDQIAAAYGGFNRIRFHPGGAFQVEPVIISTAKREALSEHLMLFFTGISRYSANVARSKIARLHQRTAQLQRISAIVEEALRFLSSSEGSILPFGELLDEAWQHKRTLSDQVTNPAIDDLYREAHAAGAIGGKLLGAGGGGFFLLFVPPDRQAAVRQRLQRLTHVPLRFDNSGSKIVLYQPNDPG
ncbi:MAG: kinase [Candidatus Competibacteraceae bacterium]|nr:kinase [Candidatus Competibacteraceae bacterium]